MNLLASFAVACDKPVKSKEGYLVCQKLALPTNGRDKARTTLTLDPAVQYDIFISSRHTIVPLLREEECMWYERKRYFRGTEKYRVCVPTPPVRFDGRHLPTRRTTESSNSTIGSYFLYNFDLKPWIPSIPFKVLGTGRRLTVALSQDFSKEILTASVVVKDSKYILAKKKEGMEKAAWEIEQATLRRQGLDWARARTELNQTVADLKRRLQNSDATLTIESSQLQRSRAENSELRNANRELIAANTALRKQVDEILWFAILAVIGVVILALFRGRQRTRQALALACENDELRLEIDEKDRHIADLLDNLATLLSRSETEHKEYHHGPRSAGTDG